MPSVDTDTKKSLETPLRCTTGVPGLDDILNGGLLTNRVYLLQGDPGVGKTTLGLQFLMEGCRLGEAALYITLSETKAELDAVAQSHGWDLSPIQILELSDMQAEMQGDGNNTFFHPSEVELTRTKQKVLDRIAEVKPKRVVFDSLSELRLMAETPLRFRRQILDFKQYFSGRDATVIFVDDRTTGLEGHLEIESIVHGVISLSRSTPAYGINRRQLAVRKIRGSRFREGHHDLVLTTGGMVIFPRLVAAEHRDDFNRECFSSGLKELDDLLGGGLDRGASTMFMGPPGTGKSTLALKFQHAAALRGEKSISFLFDETIGTLTHRATQLGLCLDKFIESGLARIQQVDPAEIAPGEMAHRISTAVQKDGVKMVIIDSINGYLNAMPEERFLNLQLHELLTSLNQQGIITIMILAQQGFMGQSQSSIDLTYLADCVLMLRYFEDHGAVRQAASVIKKRGGNHERTIREMSVDQGGIRVGEPLVHMHGVLTGVPIISGSGPDRSLGRSRL